MSPARAITAALMLSAAIPCVPAAAQTPSVLLSEGIKAYGDLDFAAAAQLLRRALEAADRRTLPPADRLRALMYLGAANVFREDRDQAVATFRTLVLTDPRYRPDALTFPPRVTQLFGEVLETTKAVGLVAPPDAQFPAGDHGLTVRAYATSRHRIEARVTGAHDQTVALLYRGVIADSMALAWNGLDSAGAGVRGGPYTLVVTSSLAPGEVLRSVRLPLTVSLRARDTLPWPQAPAPRRARGWDRRFLVPGAILGVGLAVPAALGIGGAKPVRITLGITAATVGLIGGRPPGPNVPASAETAWRRELDAARAENARRRSHPLVMVRTGEPEYVEGLDATR